MDRTDCGTVQTVSHVPARPASRQIFTCKRGAAGWGEQHMFFMFDWSALMTLQRASWTACVHLRDSYPIDVSQLNFNILCLPLL
jgi:hypothetical protein